MNGVTRIPEGFRAFAENHSVQAIRRQFSIGHLTACRMLRAVGLGDKVKSAGAARPVPEDFAKHARVRSDAWLRTHFGAGEVTVDNWRAISGIPAPVIYSERGRGPAPMPPEYPELAPTMTIAQLCEHFQRSDETIRRWSRQCGKSPRRAERRRLRAPILTLRDISTAGRAADFLKPFYTPVYKAEVLPEEERRHLPGKGAHMFVVGRKGALSAPELISLAESRGFDARDWARI